jgi:hypothetical protein
MKMDIQCLRRANNLLDGLMDWFLLYRLIQEIKDQGTYFNYY